MIKITNSTDLKQEKTNFNSQLIKMVLTKILNQDFFQKRNKKNYCLRQYYVGIVDITSSIKLKTCHDSSP